MKSNRVFVPILFWLLVILVAPVPVGLLYAWFPDAGFMVAIDWLVLAILIALCAISAHPTISKVTGLDLGTSWTWLSVVIAVESLIVFFILLDIVAHQPFWVAIPRIVQYRDQFTNVLLETRTELVILWLILIVLPNVASWMLFQDRFASNPRRVRQYKGILIVWLIAFGATASSIITKVLESRSQQVPNGVVLDVVVQCCTVLVALDRAMSAARRLREAQDSEGRRTGDPWGGGA